MVDGGLITACPVDAARQLGAIEIIGLNCMTGGWRRIGENCYIIGARRYLGTPVRH